MSGGGKEKGNTYKPNQKIPDQGYGSPTSPADRPEKEQPSNQSLRNDHRPICQLKEQLEQQKLDQQQQQIEKQLQQDIEQHSKGSAEEREAPTADQPPGEQRSEGSGLKRGHLARDCPQKDKAAHHDIRFR